MEPQPRKPRIVLVEDEEGAAAMIRAALAPEGCVLLHAPDCAAGWRLVETARPDLVILDWGLPDGSGLDVCRKIRAHAALNPIPVIVLTGKETFEEKSQGFDAGADHYLVKPLQIAEVRLWVKALLRRVQFAEEEGGLLRAEGLVLDPQGHTATFGERQVRDLTRKEFDLLYLLVKQRPRVLSKERILGALWDAVLRDNTVEVHVARLRAKLGESGRRIVTVPGVGYKFE